MDRLPSGDSVPSHPLRWFPELWNLCRKRLRPQVRLLGLALVVGVIAGLGAIVFHVACQVVVHFTLDAVVGYHPHQPGGELPLFVETARSFHPWLLLLVPALGGLLSGLLVFTVAPEAEGHGTDAAIAAYHYRQGQIRPRVPLVKIVASALTHRHGRLRRPGRTDRPDRGRVSARFWETFSICVRWSGAS